MTARDVVDSIEDRDLPCLVSMKGLMTLTEFNSMVTAEKAKLWDFSRVWWNGRHARLRIWYREV